MTPVYVITNEPSNPTGGLYAVTDDDGNTVVQMFLDEDDAISYNVHLEALGQDLHVHRIGDGTSIHHLCEIMGYAFVIIPKGEVVVPRTETLQFDLIDRDCLS